MSEPSIPALSPIGRIHSCFRDKFGTPRQPGIVPSATAELELLPPYDQAEALRGLESFSHVWIIFLFHQTMPADGESDSAWKPTVRPPRLGGNERVGVFASRSNFRPNPIGLSVVEVLSVEGTRIRLGGGDFLDQTPVLDIKPYIAYSDAHPDAVCGYAQKAPLASNRVSFTYEAARAVETLSGPDRPGLQLLIEEMLAYDPRPAYQGDEPERVYGTHLFDLEVRWRQQDSSITVLTVNPAADVA